MTPEAIERAAIIIAENRLKRTRLDLLDPVNRPADLGDAYSIQERQNEILSERGFGKLVGYKIGCTTPVMQEYLNIHEPIFGEVFDSMGFFGQSEVKYADFVEPGIEA
jgi:2-keto-4-pentenoate hydratase